MASKKFVYLDNNATTECSQEVSGILMDLIVHNIFGNPSSQHTFGLKMRAVVEASRYSVSEAICCNQDEVIFTSGGTESNNLAIKGVYNIYSAADNEVVMSAAEHSSIYRTVEATVPEDRVRIIPLTPEGTLDLEWADRLITEQTSLVSVMLASNELGTVFPVKEVVQIAHSRGALVHCDAVQAFGKIPIDVKDLGVDLLSISAHKAHGLPGAGALYVRKGVQVHPMFYGGKQEGGLRPGTESYISIVSLGAISGEIIRDGILGLPGLRDAFERSLLKRVPDIIINGRDVPRVFNTSSITFKGVHAASMVEALSEKGVFVSAGSACSSGTLKPSRTMKSMGMSDEEALSTIRFSFSKYSTPEDTSTAIEECIKCVSILRG